MIKTEIKTSKHNRIDRTLALLTCLFLFAASGCTKEQQYFFQGYVEGEYIQVSSPIGGLLETLSVGRGMTVAVNDPLFTLDPTVEAASVAEAKLALHRAEKKLADMKKGLRPSEVKAIEARKKQAQSAYDLARLEFERSRQLLQQKTVARETLDRSRTEMERSKAAVAQITAELETAKLGARPDLIEAARTEVEAARERLTQAQWRLDQQEQTAPQGGLVFDIFYVKGEFVPPGYPVVSLLPPGHVKIRFFVPEPLITTLTPGQRIRIEVDGAQQSYHGAISYISPQAEYTPPVIYSRKSRSHLVFMVEARVDPVDAPKLHPGQPADIFPEPSDG